MADRSVPHAAFEAYLREKGIPCVVVDEAGGFKALLALVYCIQPSRLPQAGMFTCQGHWDWALGVELLDYRQHMRRRPPKWETVSRCQRPNFAPLPVRSRNGYDCLYEFPLSFLRYLGRFAGNSFDRDGGGGGVA